MTPFQPQPLHMWGRTADLPSEPLAAVLTRLREARIYWLTTTRAARPPHPRPMWGVLEEEQLRLSAPSTQVAHVARSPLVSVHIDDGETVVIVEGTAAAGGGETVEEFVRVYNAKYDYRLPARPPLVVEPLQIFTWSVRGAHARDGFSRAGKWVRM